MKFHLSILVLLLLIVGIHGVFAQAGIDADGDGVPARRDQCPGQAGPESNNGCPIDDFAPPPPQPQLDTDGDGLPDSDDQCPTVGGTHENRGCPEEEPPTEQPQPEQDPQPGEPPRDAAQLTNGLEALGIYDFAAGRFVQTHRAQPGEMISLGGERIFSANSQYFAVGLFCGDFASPTWRVIVFDSATGDAEAFIDHIHPEAPDVQLSAPEVQYLDDTSVHFEMVPQGVGAWHTWSAYPWRAFGFDPTLPLISESQYTRAGVQVQPLTGEVVQSYRDDTYAAAPMDGQTPDFNAVGVGVPANNTPFTTVHADGTRYHLATRWAKGGEWILFLIQRILLGEEGLGGLLAELLAGALSAGEDGEPSPLLKALQAALLASLLGGGEDGAPSPLQRAVQDALVAAPAGDEQGDSPLAGVLGEQRLGASMVKRTGALLSLTLPG